jgi:hypothetical protein
MECGITTSNLSLDSEQRVRVIISVQAHVHFHYPEVLYIRIQKSNIGL